MSNVPMTMPELMLAEEETACGHSSTFAELDDGRVMHVAAAWRSYSEDGGLTWSDMVRDMVDANGDEVNGIALVKLSGKNSVGLVGKSRRDPEPTTYAATPGATPIIFWRSDDGGQTWTEPVQMNAPGAVAHFYQDVFIRTSSGRIILPVYSSAGQGHDRIGPSAGKLVRNQWVSTAGHFFDPHFSTSYVLYSDDEGRTWKRNADGDLMIILDWNATFSFVNEPSVTEVAPGRLLMVMRNGLGRLFQAWSNDDGETWTRPQPTSLASSTVPAQIRTLPNGHLLCVWNQENHEEVKRGYNRTRVSSAISRNGGSVWEFFQNVQSLHETTRVEPGPIEPLLPAEQVFPPGHPAAERESEHILTADVHGRWGYPSVLVMKDRVIIAHTYSGYEDHPTKAQLIRNKTDHTGEFITQKRKVLPLKWFYGGMEPANNPFLKEAYEPAKP
jgi:hypothetical protein